MAADLQRLIEVVFQGTDRVSSTAQDVGESLKGVGARAQEVTGPISSITETMLQAEAAVLALGTAFLGFAFKSSVEMESALTDLNKVLADSEGLAADYLPEIKNLSIEYGVFGDQTTAAAANFRQSGFEINDSLELVNQALLAVKVSELEAAEASNLFVTILRGFGEEATETGRLLDILNALQNNYNVSVGELARGLGDLAPIARNAGLGFEDAAALLVPVIELFGSGTEAARGLNTVFARLTGTNKNVLEGLDALKVSQTDVNDALRPAGDILKNIGDRWSTVSDNQKGAIAVQIAGTDQARKLLAVLNNYSTSLAAQEKAFDSAGSAQDEWIKQQNTSQEAINKTLTQLQFLTVAIGDQYRNQVSDAIGATGRLAEAFTKIVSGGGLEPLFNQLRPLFSELANNLDLIAVALPEAFKGLEFDPIVKGFEDIGEAVFGLFGDVDITTAQGLEDVLQNFVNIGGGVARVTAEIIRQFTPFIQGIAAAGEGFGELAPDVQAFVGQVLGLGTALDKILGYLPSFIDAITALGVGFLTLGSARAVSLLSGLASGALALAPALAAAGAAVGTWTFAVSEMTDAIDDYTIRQKLYEDAVGRLRDVEERREIALERVSQQLGTAISTMEDFNELVASGTIIFDEEAQIWRQSTDVIKENTDVRALSAEEISKAVAFELEFRDAIKQEAENIRQADEALVKKSDTVLGYRKIIDETTGSVIGYTQTGQVFVDTEQEKQKELSNSIDELKEYKLELEKLASNERIANIEAKAEIDIAQLQADTDIAISTLESLQTTVESTGEVLGDLFSIWEGASRFDQLEIQRWIDREYELREKAVEQQNKWIQAQVDYLRAKTDALSQGDPLIKISADGLEPELEAFMFRIIERVQIRAASEGNEFLLGLPT